MIATLLRPFRRVSAPPPAVPPGRLVYAIGDIHGRDDLLVRLRETIRADAQAAAREAAAEGRPAPQPVVIHLGDYVDRGLHSREAIGLLLDAPLPGFESIHLKGNHEDMLLRFLDDPSIGRVWLANGGDATLASYGVGNWRPPLDDAGLEDLRHRLRAALPPRHLAFLRGLAHCHEEGDYLFVHAGVRPGVAPAERRPEDMMWIRDGFLDSRADHGQMVVHGHSIEYRPDERPNRIGIDTGAFATGRLTALALAGATRRFLST